MITEVFYIEYQKSEDYDSLPEVRGIFTTKEKAWEAIHANVRPSHLYDCIVKGPMPLDEYIES